MNLWRRLRVASRRRRRRLRRSLAELVHRLRIEGDSPAQQAAAIGLGAFIGCTPFYGFHLPLCVAAASLFRLSRFKTVLAAHVSLPGIWPLFLIAEIQIGRWLRGAPPMSLSFAEIRAQHFWTFASDLLLGSLVFGLAVSLPLAFITYRWVSGARKHPHEEALVEAASYPYLKTGLAHWEFVRGKLHHDPQYFGMLRRGGLPAREGGRWLDLGCGRGLWLSLLQAARKTYAAGEYPADWPPPPEPGVRLHGIDSRMKHVRAARLALGPDVQLEIADLAAADLPPAQVIFLLDVLHYLPSRLQEDLLDRVVAALEPGGVLVLREADSAGGWRFGLTRAAERICALARRDWNQRFCFRSRAEWTALLAARGLRVESVPMADGTPYSNVLVEGRK